MDIAKLAAIAAAGTLMAILLRKDNPAAAMLVGLACCAVMTAYIIGGIKTVFDGFCEIVETGGVEPYYYKSVIKVIAVAYFTQITASLCRDAGESAVAAKLELGGKIIVLIITLPIVAKLLQVICEALTLL